MLGEKHDLIHEFPDHVETIHQLKMTDRHFEKLFKEYHDVDHEVLRIEEGVETPSDTYTEDRKKRRLQLKDELYKIIIKAEKSKS